MLSESHRRRVTLEITLGIGGGVSFRGVLRPSREASPCPVLENNQLRRGETVKRKNTLDHAVDATCYVYA